MFPCSLKQESCSLVPYDISPLFPCFLVPKNPWETLISDHEVLFVWPACDIQQERTTALLRLDVIKTTPKIPVVGVSKNKKIQDRVDSEGQYERWKLWVMGSWLNVGACSQ